MQCSFVPQHVHKVTPHIMAVSWVLHTATQCTAVLHMQDSQDVCCCPLLTLAQEAAELRVRPPRCIVSPVACRQQDSRVLDVMGSRCRSAAGSERSRLPTRLLQRRLIGCIRVPACQPTPCCHLAVCAIICYRLELYPYYCATCMQHQRHLAAAAAQRQDSAQAAHVAPPQQELPDRRSG